MTAQAKPPIEGEDNTSVPVADNQYDEEETFESVLGKRSFVEFRFILIQNMLL